VSEAHFAEAPVLNPQQLVLTFMQPVSSHSRWEMETVPLGVKRKGRLPGGSGARRVAGVHSADGFDIVMITQGRAGAAW